VGPSNIQRQPPPVSNNLPILKGDEDLKIQSQRTSAVRSTAIALGLLATACSQQPMPRDVRHSEMISSVPVVVGDAINGTADAWVGSGKAVGVMIEVAQSGRVVFARGYGRPTLEGDDPITDRTQFRIGSVTKQFTAAAILQLVGEGRISLDDTLSHYLPDFPRAS